MSTQNVLSREGVNPDWQMQWYDPGVFSHLPFKHILGLSAHSLISAHKNSILILKKEFHDRRSLQSIQRMKPTDASILRRRQRVTIVALALEGSIHVGAVSVVAHARVLALVVICKRNYNTSETRGRDFTLYFNNSAFKIEYF